MQNGLARMKNIEFLPAGEGLAALVTVEVAVHLYPGGPPSDLVTVLTDVRLTATDTIQAVFDRASQKAAAAIASAGKYSSDEVTASMVNGKSYQR